MKKSLLMVLLLCASIHTAKSQVLISLLLGDKLNSEKLSFGLDGGLALSSLSNLSAAERNASFFLGFYFDFALQEPWSLYTGVMVKSTLGAQGLAPYALGNEDLDTLLSTASIRRKLSYFNVPVMIRYRLPRYIFFEGGLQLGLLHQAVDEFSNSIAEDDDLHYRKKVGQQYKKIDFGLSVGAGYHLMKGKGISLGIRYYGGLINIKAGSEARNNAFYLFANIPVGRHTSE